MDCDNCVYNVYDEEEDAWFCECDMDQDDYLRFLEGHHQHCPYYRNGDEYAIVRHQM